MTQITQTQIDTFKKNNTNFNFISFNFTDQKALKSIKWSGLKKEQVKSLQRLLDLTGDETQAIALHNADLHSCFQITALTKEAFRQQYDTVVGGDSHADQIYQRAMARSSQLMMHYINLISHTGSHFRTGLTNNLSVQTDKTHRHLPNYEAMFGSENYYEVPHDRSIFSPAAYLVDLIRFKERNIHDSKVDDKHKLSYRRPDLDDLILDSASTETIVPKLEIVNSILEGHVASVLPPSPIFDPLIYLPFNGNTDDQSGNKRPITQTGNGLFTLGGMSGRMGLTFDGHTYLTTPKLNVGSNYTFAAWVKIAKNESGKIVSSPDVLSFELDDGDAWGNLVFGIHGLSGYEASKTNLAPDTWHHIALTMGDSGTLYIFVDGISVTGKSGYRFGISQIETKFNIGEGFTGTMDSVSIYDRALTGEQIATLAAQTPTDRLYAHLAQQTYPFNLPFHLPLAQIRAALSLLKTDLPTLWQTFSISDPTKPPPRAIVQEILQLSPETYALLTTAKSTKANLRRMYGLKERDDRFDLSKGLLKINVFLEKTGLTQPELNNLLFSDLSRQELDAGVHKSFFINADDTKGEPIGIDADSGSLTHLSLTRLDRLHRFIRFARQLGWSFSDLDWALRTAAPKAVDMNDQSLAVLTQLKSWKEKYKRPVTELCSFIGVVKNEGNKNGRSFFEQIFQPKHVKTGVSLTDERLLLNFANQDSQQRHIQQTLIAALAISEADLHLIVSTVGKAFDVQDDSLPLGPDQLAALYRLSQVPQMLGMSVADAMSLLELMGNTHLNTLAGQPTVLAADTINQLAERHEWLQSANISMHVVRYILTGSASASFPMQLGKEEIINFLNDLSNAWHGIPMSLKKLTDEIADKALQQKSLEKKTPKQPQKLEALHEELKRLQQKKLDQEASQQKTLEAHLMSLLCVSHAALSPLNRWANPTEDKSQTLLGILVESIQRTKGKFSVSDDLPKPIRDRLTQLNRYACLTKTLHLTGPELESILRNPSYYNIDDLTNLTLADLYHLYQFKQLVYGYQDRNNGFIHYLSQANAPTTKQDEIFRDLSHLTQWDAPDEHSPQIATLIDKLWPSSRQKKRSASPYGTVAGLIRMKHCFDSSKNLGMRISSLWQLAELSQSHASYEDFAQAATQLMAALKAKYSEPDWDKVNQPIRVSLNEQKRDALVSAVIVQLQQAGIKSVKESRDLYEYLLIDVEVSGLFDTSWLKEALGCLQLYIYRCHMRLEDRVTLTTDFEQYWTWIKNYRVWEANRKVFLYPENYIQPDLRKTKTPLFGKLEQSLQQTHLSKESVDKAVKTYLDSFAEVANLQHAGSYAVSKRSSADANHQDRNPLLVGPNHISIPVLLPYC